MLKGPLVGVLPVLVTLALVAIPNGGGAVPTNVDVSQRVGNESEEAIAVNPTNPQNIVVVTNIQEGFSGLFEGVSFDGGQTWARKIIATVTRSGAVPTVSATRAATRVFSFDQYGNLFLSYLYNVENVVPVALSTDGGLNFTRHREHRDTAAEDDRGQGAVAARRCPLRRPGDDRRPARAWSGSWSTPAAPWWQPARQCRDWAKSEASLPAEVIPGTNNCTYGDIAIGPGGKVMTSAP